MADILTTLTWKVDVESGSNDVVVNYNGVTETLTIAPGTYDGVSFSGADYPPDPTLPQAGSTSLSRAFADALETHSEIPSVDCGYDYIGLDTGPLAPSFGGNPGFRWDISPSAAVRGMVVLVDILTTIDYTAWGFSRQGDGGSISSGGQIATRTNRTAVWCPLQADNVADIRNLSQTGSFSMAGSASSVDSFNTTPHASIQTGSLVYDTVDDVYIRKYRTGDVANAWTARGRTIHINGGNNLELLLQAAAANKTISVYHSATTSPAFNCKILPPWDIGALTTAIGSSDQKYTVTINHTVVQ